MPRTPHKFGPAARRRFLEHLKETGHLGQSAAAAGVHYTTTRRRLLPGHRLYDSTLVDDRQAAGFSSMEPTQVRERSRRHMSVRTSKEPGGRRELQITRLVG